MKLMQACTSATRGKLQIQFALLSMLPGIWGTALSAEPPGPDTSIDLTGPWVAVVTEDWRWRMVTPARGDAESVPLNPHGHEVTNAWDPDRDEAAGEQCRAYGAAGIMRMPTRLRITRENATTLRIETDAGQQTRVLHFDGKPAPADFAPTWQGYTSGQWPLAPKPPAKGPTDSVKAVTTHLRPGYLRKNGVPYSENTRVTEYFDRIDESDGTSWLLVTTLVDDPQYLTSTFVTSSHFRKERDTSKWNPRPCEIVRPAQ